tara:strand:- start:39 stop:386 length:348 start_codon:yes stop_codon:yes gene_type:complete
MRSIKHKHTCNNSNSRKYNYKLYQFIRANGGWANWKIIVEYETKGYDKWNRWLLEQVYKDDLEPVLNMVNALGLDKERRRIGINKNAKIKAKCNYCDKEMNKSSIRRHIKSQHFC